MVMTRREGWRDIVERSALTAIETALSVVFVDEVFIGLPEGTTWQVIATSTVITFLWNVVRRRQAVLQR